MEYNREPFLAGGRWQGDELAAAPRLRRLRRDELWTTRLLCLIAFVAMCLAVATLILPIHTEATSSALRGKGVFNTAASSCPAVHPVGHSLNLDEWTSKSWYVQEQQVTAYQKPEDLFCVVATYEPRDKVKVPLFSGNVIGVHNYANIGSVNGKASNANNATILCAREPHKGDGSRLLVAPCFLPNFLAGDYWVVAVGDDSGPNPSAAHYTWAAISGGQPTVKFDDGCTTKEKGTYGGVGLWIFSRTPVASEAQLNFARQALKDKGYTLSRMRAVPQEGCKYAGAYIKK